MSVNNLGVLIMAAGESRRFYGCKQLAVLNGKPLIQNALDQSSRLDVSKRIVVTGRWHNAIEQALEQSQISDCDLVFNPDWSRGLGNSISFGVSLLAGQCDAILIILADQVDVDVSDLEALINSVENHQAACAKYQGTRGVPALFRKDVFPELLMLKGEKGAKALLQSQQLDIVEVEMPAAAVDVDTRDQLIALNEKGPHRP